MREKIHDAYYVPSFGDIPPAFAVVRGCTIREYSVYGKYRHFRTRKLLMMLDESQVRFYKGMKIEKGRLLQPTVIKNPPKMHTPQEWLTPPPTADEPPAQGDAAQHDTPGQVHAQLPAAVHKK